MLSELWPYLKQGPNEGQFAGDYSPAALHEVGQSQRSTEEVFVFEWKQNGNGRERRFEEEETENLTWEQSSMTSSTTEVLDFIHTRPVEINRTSVQRSNLKAYDVFHGLLTAGQQLKIFKANNF